LWPEHPLWVKLKTALPLGLLTEAVVRSGKQNRRAARLPAVAVLFLVVAAALFRYLPLERLLKVAGLASPKDGRDSLASGTLTEARKRLGPEPVRELLHLQTQDLCHPPTPGSFLGLTLLALDGSKVRTPDSPENRAHWGGHRNQNADSAFPLMRVMLLMHVVSRCVLDVVCGSFHIPELKLGTPLLDRVPPRSLLLMDKLFFSALWFITLQRKGEQRHVLLPLSERASYRVTKTLGPGDELVTFTVSQKAHKHIKDAPATFQMRVLTLRLAGWRPIRLATTLLDPVLAPKAVLAPLYRQRWNIELGLDELKTHQMEQQTTLRSRLPALCEQEMYGMWVAYNVVRKTMVERAKKLGVSPHQISFVGGLQVCRWGWSSCWQQEAPERVEEGLWGRVLPKKREGRRCPRVVKLGRSAWPTKKRQTVAETAAFVLEEMLRMAA